MNSWRRTMTDNEEMREASCDIQGDEAKLNNKNKFTDTLVNSDSG